MICQELCHIVLEPTSGSDTELIYLDQRVALSESLASVITSAKSWPTKD